MNSCSDIFDAVSLLHQQDAVDALLRLIPCAMDWPGKVAVVLGGSSEMLLLRSRISFRWDKELEGTDLPRPTLRLLHAQLHNFYVPKSSVGNLCLLATEAIYRRANVLEDLDVVIDSCQVLLVPGLCVRVHPHCTGERGRGQPKFSLIFW